MQREKDSDSDRGRPADSGAELMLAYQRGDESAFDRLVADYSGQVYALVTRFLGPVPGREDLVQEVFLRVIRARERYEPTARFSTWLYRIVFNLTTNERQKRAARSWTSLDAPVERGGGGEVSEWEDEDAALPSHALEKEDVSSAVRRAIAALPPNQRMALVLAKYEELPYAEVAQVLGSTEKAIKSMIHRARETLRASLAPFLEGEYA